MAEILFDDDDEDNLWIEDPYDDADNLAEHTMQSPVLINYDHTLDLDSGEEWEDWSGLDGDFFDQETPTKQRRKSNHLTNGKQASSTRKTQRKVASIEALPEISLGEPASSDAEDTVRHRAIVQWKVRKNSPQLPIFQPGQQEKVSILKDWKERFKLPMSKAETRKSSPSNGTQRAVAVVIETRKGSLNPTGSKRRSDLAEQVLKSTATISQRDKAPNTSDSDYPRGASAPKISGHTATRKRKLGLPTEPAPEPVPKRQSTRQSDIMTQHKVAAQAGQKRKADEGPEGPELQSKRAKTKTMDDATTKKEGVRPKMNDDAATKKENIRPKPVNGTATKKEKIRPRPSDNAAARKGNVRPKDTAAERRSTRRK
ncbi:MAG: hypothetical protein LQ339_001885 [Xanthoria mediterranea]|nr:MAG: hypothetical protein LQ339_001885 [Xanthoria mediterranea]